jgi:uncharacterized protein (TIGR00369 family)
MQLSVTEQEADMNPVATESIAIDADEILDDLLYPAGHHVLDGEVGDTEPAGLDQMLAYQRGEVPPPPISATLRFALIEVEEGRAVFEGHPGAEHYNPIGVVHGGYAATLLDSAMGCAVHTTLPAGSGYTTLTLETKYVRPITSDTGTVYAEGWVVHRGRRQATTEARLVAAETGKLVAHAAGTCMIFER